MGLGVGVKGQGWRWASVPAVTLLVRGGGPLQPLEAGERALARTWHMHAKPMAASVDTVSVAIVSIAPLRERQPPRSDRDTHSDLPSVSCGRLLHVAAQSLCMNPGFFSHSPWSAQETQLELLSILVPAGHSSCRRGTAAGAVDGRGAEWRGRGLARSSGCTVLSTGGAARSSGCTVLSTGGGTRSAARSCLSGCGWPTPRATALTRRRPSSFHIARSRRPGETRPVPAVPPLDICCVWMVSETACATTM